MTTAADASGNGHDGTYVGSAANASSLVVGDSNAATQFHAATFDHVVQNDTIPAQAFSALTIGCLLKSVTPTDPNQPPLFGINNPNNTDDCEMGMSTSGGVFFTAIAANSSFFDIQSPPLTANTVYRAIGIWDGTTAKLYLNGAEVASDSFVGPVEFITNEQFYVATEQNQLGSNQTFDGTVDECFFVANHAATPTEIGVIDAAWTGTGSASAAVLALPSDPANIYWRLADLAGGNFLFNPPTEGTVPPVAYDVPPIANALMRYFPSRLRGKAVWHLEDDTISFDQPYPTVFPDAAQHSDLWPVPPVSTWWGSNLTAVTAKVVYYGGHTYIVNQAEETLLAAFLTAQGYTPGDWLVPI